MLAPAFSRSNIEIPVIKTVATLGAASETATDSATADTSGVADKNAQSASGIPELWKAIDNYLSRHLPNERKNLAAGRESFSSHTGRTHERRFAGRAPEQDCHTTSRDAESLPAYTALYQLR